MKSMLRIFLISFLTAISLIICNCAGSGSEDSAPNDVAHGIVAQTGQKLVTMRVPQIPCGKCQANVQAVLKSQPGIVDHKVYKTKERTQNVIVVYDPTKIQLDDIKALITKLPGKTVENVIEE